MTTKIQVRRDLAATWTSVNPTLSDGEIGFETDTNKFKIGANSTAWNTLDYAAGSIAVGNGLITDSYGVTNVKKDGTLAFDSYGYLKVNYGNSLTLDSYGKLGVKVADSYGIMLNWDGSVISKVDQSTVSFDNYGRLQVRRGQGITLDGYGLTLNLGSGLSFDSYGRLQATGSGSGALSLMDFSGLQIDSYGKLGVSLSYPYADWDPSGNVTGNPGLKLDSYGNLRINFSDYQYYPSGFTSDSYGVRIKLGRNYWDMFTGVNSNGASGLEVDQYGLHVALKQDYMGGSGLVVDQYGLSVAIDSTGGIVKGSYGLKIDSSKSTVQTNSYGRIVRASNGFSQFNPQDYSQMYVPLINTNDPNTPTVAGSIDSFEATITVKNARYMGTGTDFTKVFKVVGTINNDGQLMWEQVYSFPNSSPEVFTLTNLTIGAGEGLYAEIAWGALTSTNGPISVITKIDLMNTYYDNW